MSNRAGLRASVLSLKLTPIGRIFRRSWALPAVFALSLVAMGSWSKTVERQTHTAIHGHPQRTSGEPTVELSERTLARLANCHVRMPRRHGECGSGISAGLFARGDSRPVDYDLSPG